MPEISDEHVNAIAAATGVPAPALRARADQIRAARDAAGMMSLVCGRCGATVADSNVHQIWHDGEPARIAAALSDLDRKNGPAS